MSMRRSAGLISTFSISSSSGRIATVTAEVWMRPWASVAGTRCTRWVPDSNLSCENAPRPTMRLMTSAIAAVLARALAQRLDLPALRFGVAAVHAQQVAGEDRRLVAAGAGADLEEDIAAHRADRAAAAAAAARRSRCSRRCRTAASSSSPSARMSESASLSMSWALAQFPLQPPIVGERRRGRLQACVFHR